MTLQSPSFPLERLTTATQAYSVALRAMIEQRDYGDCLRDALAALENGARGENDCVAALRRSLAVDLHRTADRNMARMTATAVRSVDVSALHPHAQVMAKCALRDMGYVVAEPGTGDVALAVNEDLGRVAADPAPQARPTTLAAAHIPGHWTTDPDGGNHGGFAQSGILTRLSPDGAPQYFRLVAGRFHQATKSKRVASVKTSVGIRILPCDAAGDVTGPGPAMQDEHYTPNMAARFYSDTGWRLFNDRTKHGTHTGFSTGSGHEKHGHALSMGVVRTTEMISRLGHIGAVRSSKSLGKKILFKAHPAPATAAQIADRFDPMDPFGAYYAPAQSDPDPLIIAASPYFKVISAGPDQGPALVFWVRGLREFTGGKFVRETYRLDHGFAVI